MALKITDAGIEFPYVFMLSQSICQQTTENFSAPPIYTLSLIWTYYKINEDGSVTYNPDGQFSYYDDNFYISAVTDMGAGQTDHISTLTAQIASIKKIVMDETGYTVVDE